MDARSIELLRQYQKRLGSFVKTVPNSSLQPARALGRRAMALGLETLDLARHHEQALIPLLLPASSPSAKARLIRRAGIFFAETVTPIERTHRTSIEANVQLLQLNQTLRKRTVELTASNRKLKIEVRHRKSVEESLRLSEQHYGQLLRDSKHMQEQLRLLSRQLLSAQEEERKLISRELHDEVAQTLTGINIRLASLKSEATISGKGLQEKISSTQRLVQKSVDIVHRFARDLRPTVLDDLGLIPALHSFMKSFTTRTGVHTALTAFEGVEHLNVATRTALFRVAQEALTNVARHAQASRAEVTITKLRDQICMEVWDNGKSFEMDPTRQSNGGKRLGLLGMRERTEMVGGSFAVKAAPGMGTTIQTQIPLGTARAKGSGKSARMETIDASDA